MRHGFGTKIWPDGPTLKGAKYEGYWKNDMAHGKGTLWHANGEKYEGCWKRN